MRLLLDTHTFLWFVLNDLLLSAAARQQIEDADSVFLSIASIWELAIKTSTGKITLTPPLEQFIPKQLKLASIDLLPIEVKHLVTVSQMPFHHRDPFDRLIIAQSIRENMAVVSVDKAFDAYGVTRVW